MNRLTLLSMRKKLATVLSVCETVNGRTNPVIIEYANEAQPLLMRQGKWVGTVQDYQFCLAENCFATPRQVENVESFAVCGTPGDIRNGWYGFSRSGPGIIGENGCYCGSMLLDKGTTCAFSELDNANSASRIQVSTTVPEAAGARILLQGYDETMNWIRTIDTLTGEYVDGEWVDVINARTTTKYFAKLTDAQKPITNGPVTLSEKDDTLGTVVKTLAIYESDETHPIFRRYMLPGMSGHTGGCCGSTSADCNSQSVTIRAKLRHISVRLDTDWFILQNDEALKLAVMAVKSKERHLWPQAQTEEANAIASLKAELSSFEGDGPLPTLKQADSAGWGGAVAGVIGSGWNRY